MRRKRCCSAHGHPTCATSIAWCKLHGTAARGQAIAPGELPAWTRPAKPQEHAAVAPRRKAVAAPTREEFVAAFERLGGSVRGLAKHFERDRRQIYRWLAAHGLKGRS
jgi:hypothetical protein